MNRIFSIILIIVSIILLSISFATFYVWNNSRELTTVRQENSQDKSNHEMSNKDEKFDASSTIDIRSYTSKSHDFQTTNEKKETFTELIIEVSDTTNSKTYFDTESMTSKTESVTAHERRDIYSTFPNEQTKNQDVTTETTKTESIIDLRKNDNVNDEIFFTRARTNEKVIFITIDDGPGNYTPQILDLLKQYNIKAIFFVSGDTVLGYREHLKREYEEGHSIGSHTYCHRSYYKLQKTADLETLKETLRSDIEKTEENIKKIIPEIKIRYLRMPEGYSKDWVKEIAKEYGYKIINWTAGYDWFQEPVEQTIERYKQSLKPGGIYLFHDGRDRGLKTTKILSELIPYAISQGYKFGDPKDYF